jgi:hypothetical protein
MQAFRVRGIKPDGALFFSEDALRWPLANAELRETRLALSGMPEPAASDEATNQSALHSFVERNRAALGLGDAGPLEVFPLEIAQRAARDDVPQLVLTTHVTGEKRTRGVTLVFDGAGRLRYAIPAAR